ncbi:MAG: DUF4124 domain-containing protein [Burkholderiaceae bacterium]|nr:DUF4124 domain-containing protein [Burkholderiaceae bacterium]
MTALPRSLSMSRAAALLGSALLLSALALPAAAQWAWRDASGRTVYSDQPPPAGVKKDQILRQPGGGVIAAPAPGAAPATGSAAPAAAGAAGKAAPGGPKTLAEREQEFRKRQQDRAEAEKKAADEQALNARKQDECNRARGYLRQLEDGVRIARTDAQGNREILDDNARNAEMTRARELIKASCGG